jgi:Ca2+-transporting ATPase
MIVSGYEFGSSEISYYSKGSVESILSLCQTYYNQDQQQLLNEEMIDIIHKAHDQMAGEGLRVLACAAGEDSSAMIFLGLIGIHDVPRPNIQKNLEKLIGMGIQIIMITGDSGDLFF